MNNIVNNKNEKYARLFFALQSSKKIQKTLGQVVEKLIQHDGGRLIKPENIHLTLLFLGKTDIDKITALKTAVGNITAKTFNLTIGKTRFWKRNQIIYAHADIYPPELFTLVDAIKNAVQNAGFEFDSRAFKPHITLARKVTCHTPVDFQQPIQWHVKEWLLMQSKQTDQGIRYTTLGRWPLH
ncbi:MAG: RNA 2',3'-cyclic phosphodiesterase [Burkholderiales bacterium]|nr:RNA 2',3'-cyclic phosphodiesterase [Burkholderiales bacterium]MDR4515974.1 RNA 2',3'-cyclic phosphodiesterase [Nitrosomonas sp.]